MSDWWNQNKNLITNIAGSAIDAGINGSLPSVPKPTGNMNSPYFYQGQYQPQMDQMFYGNTQNYGAYNPYVGTVFPGQATAYGQIGQYNQAMQNNPYAGQMQGMSNWASPQMSQLGNQGQFYGNQMLQSGAGGLGIADQLRGETYNYQYANPMIQGAQQGGQAMSGVGQAALGSAAGLGKLASSYADPLSGFATGGLSGLQNVTQAATAGLMPYAQGAASQLPGMAAGYAMPGQAAGLATLNTAFDPQNELYSREYMKNLDSTRAALASRGLNKSLVGAGAEADSARNFNLDWQDRALGRQTAGLGAYGQNAATNYGMQSSALGQGLDSLTQASQATYNPYLQTYGAGVGGLNTAATTGYGLQSAGAKDAYTLGTAGAQNITQGAAQPWEASQNVFNNQINQLGQLGGLSGLYGQQMNQGMGTIGTGLQNRYGSSQLPYGTYNQIQGDKYLGANNYLNAGNTMMGGAQVGAGINLNQGNQMLNYLNQGTSAANAYGNANNGWLYASMLPYQGMYASGGGGSSLGGDLAKLALGFF